MEAILKGMSSKHLAFQEKLNSQNINLQKIKTWNFDRRMERIEMLMGNGGLDL